MSEVMVGVKWYKVFVYHIQHQTVTWDTYCCTNIPYIVDNIFVVVSDMEGYEKVYYPVDKVVKMNSIAIYTDYEKED